MSLLEKLKEEVITDPLLQKQYETEKEIYNIAKCLKKIRKEKKLTQKDIANKTGLSQQMVSKIESYNGNPSIESFVKYCNGICHSFCITRRLIPLTVCRFFISTSRK